MNKIASCIVCDEKNFMHLFEMHDRMFDIPGMFIVKKCRTCGLVFVDPIPSQQKLKKHYPNKNYYSYQEGGEKGFFYCLRSYLVKHYYNKTLFSRIFSGLVQNVPAMPKGTEGKILDVGCGTGDTIELLKQLGWDVYGLEIDKKAVLIAKKRGLHNVKHGTVKDMSSYPNNHFDVIRLYHVIEHLSDPNLCLRLIYKKLKPGGEIIMGTPNVESLASNLFKKFWYNLDTPRHLFVFSPKTLAVITEREGFGQVSIEFCSAGGLVGSIMYVSSHLTKKKLDPNNFLWLFFLLYPLEWFLDKLRIGDIFILRAVKEVIYTGKE